MKDDRGRARGRFGRWIADAFVVRQVIVRASGRTRYVEISTRAQIGAVLLGVGLVGWSLAAAVGAWRAVDIVASRTEAIASAFDAQRELADSRHALSLLLAENDQLKSGLAATEARLRGTEAERERAGDAHASTRRQVARLEADLQRIAAQNAALAHQLDDASGRLQTLGQQNAALVALRAAQDGRLEAQDRQIAETAARAARLDADLRAATLRLADADRDRDATAGAGDALRARVTELESRLAAAEELHRRTVQRYDELALAGILEVERLVGRTGVRLESLLPGQPVGAGQQPARRRGGQGGPFVPWRPRDVRPSIEELRISLAERVDRLGQMRDLVRALPLGVPLDESTIMSGFGYRRDPLNNRAAMHLGVDLSAPMRSPVYPSAPGRVVFAGWQADLGRIVEIDHGFGIRTRYAHLARMLVEAGDIAAIERPIGLLGTSGRSTGPHLHYEVLVKDKNVDPEKFMRANRHVLQIR